MTDSTNNLANLNNRSRKSLKRSLSEVLRRKKDSSSTNVSIRDDNQTQFTMPRNKSQPVSSKTYCEMTPEEINLLGSSALKRLNALFKLHKLKPVGTDVIRSVQISTGLSTKKKWWTAWKKESNLDSKDQIVFKIALCKSIEYASMPCESDESFNLRRVPILVYECIKYIKANGLLSSGIFRVNGSEKRMAQMTTAFDAGPLYGHGFNFEGYSIYDVADCLKKYLRLLPEPLLTSELYPFFMSCMDIPVDDGARLKAFRWLCMQLPPPHLVLLEYLLDLFSSVVANAAVNQMTVTNLARIFSPNLLRPRVEKTALEEFQRCSFVLEFLIEHRDQFCTTNKDIKPFDILDASYLVRPQGVLTQSQVKSERPTDGIQATPPGDATLPTTISKE